MGAILAMFSAVYFPKVGFNLDVARWLRETVHPRDYLNTPYYDLWLRSVATFLAMAHLWQCALFRPVAARGQHLLLTRRAGYARRTHRGLSDAELPSDRDQYTHPNHR